MALIRLTLKSTDTGITQKSINQSQPLFYSLCTLLYANFISTMGCIQILDYVFSLHSADFIAEQTLIQQLRYILSCKVLFVKPNLIDSINLRIPQNSILIFVLQFKKFQNALTEHELIIGVLLYKLQLGITHNVHLIYRLSGDMSGGIPLVQTGSAVYHNCVLFNHSCAPNTTRFFQVSSNPRKQ